MRVAERFDVIWPEWQLLWKSASVKLSQLLYNVPNIVIAVLTVIAAYWVARFTRGVILRAGERTKADTIVLRLLSRITVAVIRVVGILIAISIVFPDRFNPGQVFAGLGVTSVAIGFAMKDVLQNFFAGILLLWQQPFRAGDEIRTKDYEGTVEEISLRSTSLITYDGERAILPNSDVYTSAVLVRTAFEQRRTRLSVTVSQPGPDSQLNRRIAEIVSNVEGVRTSPAPVVHLASLSQTSSVYRVQFWVEANQAAATATVDRVIGGLRSGLPEISDIQGG